MKKKSSDSLQKAMILIASADAALRERCVPGLEDDFAILAVSKRAELERALIQYKPTVLLLDLDLPQIGGMKGVRAMCRLSPSTNLILICGRPYDKQAVEALKSGAKGYYGKEIAPSLLRKAVSVVQKGEVWVGRKAVSRLLEELCSSAKTDWRDYPAVESVRLQYLTPRQRQIACLVGEGASNKEIAVRLNISESTAKGHLTKVFRKLQIPDRLRLGLLVAGKNKTDHLQ